VKESDRVRAMVELLTAFGVPAEERPDGMVVEGVPDRPLKAIRVQSHGDHRIAMTAAVLALVSEDVCVVEDVDCVATSFPRFAGTLRALGAEIAVES
nr:3-phosphoshikimate 1-carboxyvinyltransferase [Polyangiaceae bacterium]